MLTTTKALVRETERINPNADRKIMVQLGPSDCLTLWEKGRRYKVHWCLHYLYVEGVKRRLANEGDYNTLPPLLN